MLHNGEPPASLPPGEKADADGIEAVFADSLAAETELHGIRDGVRFAVAGSISREDALKAAKSLQRWIDSD